MLEAGRHFGTVLVHYEVDFGPHPEARQVNARLDGDGHAGQDAAGVVRLEVVQVGGFAVGAVEADRVAGAVGEPLAVTGGFDVAADDVVDVATARILTGRHGVAHEADPEVARFRGDPEDPGQLRVGLPVNPAPGYVRVWRAGFLFAGEQVDEHAVALFELPVAAVDGSVVGIAGVRAEADDGRVRIDEARVVQAAADEVLHRRF